MGKGLWVQCQQCGKLHKTEVGYTSEDDLYIQLLCPRCRDGTHHLIIGEHKEDVYVYGNNNLDERFYNYNTK